MIRLFACASALALVTLAAAPAAQAKPASHPAASAKATQAPPIVYKQRILPNGLRVLTSLDRTTPNVTVQVWYGVGSKNDPDGRSGFAHLFEHLMFKATKDLPSENFDRLTEDVGGFNNASTWDDFTNYYEVVPAAHLERMIWAEGERMGSLVVDADSFKSERDVVKEELRQRVLADPYGRFFRLLIPAASFTTHPYKRPGIGSIEELDAATLDDVLTFHHTFYRPANATLIVVGNFDEAQLNAYVDKYLAPLKNPDIVMPKVTVKEPPRTGPRTVTGYGPNVPLPAIAITWQGPEASDPDAPALAVLDAILSGGKSSRLYDSLVYDKKLAQAAFSSTDTRAQPGLFYVGAIMAGGKSLDQGEAALRAEVARVRDKPVTAAELAEAKAGLVADAVRGRESVDDRAFALGYALETTGDPNEANSAIAKLQKVSIADVQRVAKKYLPDDRRVVVRYLPESARPAGETDKAEAPKPVPSPKYDGPVFALLPEGQRQAPPPVGQAVSPTLPTPAEKVLPNGLRVIVARSSNLPLVTADLTVRGGASSDPQGLAGASSMTAELLTEGTTTRSAQDIAQQTEALGANLSAASGWESTSVTLNVTADKLAPGLTILADVVRNPSFKDEELDRVRTQSLDALTVAFQRPGSLAGYVTAPVIYAGGPFGHVASGTPDSLKKIKTTDLSALHGAMFRPDNAILVLTGDITPQEGFALAEKAFGDWEKPDTALPVLPGAGAVAPPRQVIIDLPGTGQAAVVVTKRAITRNDPHYYEGIVATSVLGGGYSARLNQEIRIKRGLSYGANASLTARRSSGGFTASAQTKNESAGQVVTLIYTEMTKLAGAPASAEELTARKSGLIGAYGRNLATTDGLADILGTLALYNIDLSEIGLYTGKVDAVTPAQVQDFATRVFDPSQSSVIIVGDASKFGADVKTVLPKAETVPVTDLDLDDPSLRKKK
ncbi:MAG: peptidase [Caulobacter sp.]|nr:peptidase [Caulobacter sp.]